jgi:hypothetical protein
MLLCNYKISGRQTGAAQVKISDKFMQKRDLQVPSANLFIRPFV